MKNTIKTLCLSVIILTFSYCTKAQDAAVQSAFETSYALEKTGQYLKAANTIKSVYNESSYEINLRLGYLLYENASYRESSKYYKKAVEIKPNSVEARLGYVLPLAVLASWDTVKIQYENILKIDPYNTTANYRMGLIYYYKADNTTALPYFEKVYSIYPFDYDNTLMYAWTKLKLNKTAEAKTLFNIVLLIKPKDASALEGLKAIK